LSPWKNRPLPARFACAARGLARALASEQSLKIQLAVLVLVLIALLVLRPGPIWWALVLASSATVLASELLNTALETLADALHPGQSDAVRDAKDASAAAVLIASLGALAVAVALAVHLLGASG
jgi:undecaprenol kinase